MIYMISILDIGDPIIAPAEELNWQAAQFLINIRETCGTSQVALENIRDGVTSLMKTYRSHILVRL